MPSVSRRIRIGHIFACAGQYRNGCFAGRQGALWDGARFGYRYVVVREGEVCACAGLG